MRKDETTNLATTQPIRPLYLGILAAGAILAIGIAIVFPKLMSARYQLKLHQVQSRLQSLHTALSLYADLDDGLLPATNDDLVPFLDPSQGLSDPLGGSLSVNPFVFGREASNLSPDEIEAFESAAANPSITNPNQFLPFPGRAQESQVRGNFTVTHSGKVRFVPDTERASAFTPFTTSESGVTR